MAQWRKVIVSGSNPELNNVTSSGDFHFDHDGAKMRFGDDGEVTLTHVHNDGLLLSDASGIGTTKLNFGDSATFVQQSADGILNVQADTLVQMTGNVSMSANLNVVGDIHSQGNITFMGDSGGNIQMGDNANDNLIVAADISSSLIPNANGHHDLGSTGQRWNNLFLSGSITAIEGPHTLDSDSTIDIDSATGTSIDAGAASNFSTTAGALTLAGVGGVNIAGSAAEIDITTTGALDVNSGAFTLDASTISIDGTDNMNITTGGTGKTLDIDASGALTIDSAVSISIGTTTDKPIDIDATTLSIDTTDNINITAGSTGKTLDIDASGALTIDSGTSISIGAAADKPVIIDSTTFDLDASAAIAIDGVGNSNLTTDSGNLTLSNTTSGNVVVNSVGIVDIDGTTSVNLDGGALNVGVGAALPVDLNATTLDIDTTGAVTVDGTSISIDGTAASNFTLSDGDLSLIADGADNAVIIKGDHTAGTAVHIDANENAASVVDIDAGKLDIDASADVHITTATTFDVDSTGAVTIDSDAATTIGGSSVDIDADGGAITLNGTAGATFGDDVEALAFDGSGNVDFDAVALDIDTSGAITMDSTSTIVISGDGGATLSDDTKALAYDGSGNVDFDAATLDIDGTGPLTIDTTNTGTGLTLATGTSAVPVTIGHTTSEVTVQDNLNVGGNVVVTGDLDVNGTLTSIDTTNLTIKDAFVQLASGSASQTNAGIIANTTADGSGSAFYYDGTNNFNRWALTGAGETGFNATGDVIPRQFIMTVSQSAASPTGNPGDFGANDYSRRGMVYIQSSDDATTNSVEGDIWIWS